MRGRRESHRGNPTSRVQCQRVRGCLNFKGVRPRGQRVSLLHCYRNRVSCRTCHRAMAINRCRAIRRCHATIPLCRETCRIKPFPRDRGLLNCRCPRRKFPFRRCRSIRSIRSRDQWIGPSTTAEILGWMEADQTSSRREWCRHNRGNRRRRGLNPADQSAMRCHSRSQQLNGLSPCRGLALIRFKKFPSRWDIACCLISMSMVVM